MKSKNLLKSIALKTLKFGVAALSLSVLINSSMANSAFAGGSDRGGADLVTCDRHWDIIPGTIYSIADVIGGESMPEIAGVPVGALYSAILQYGDVNWGTVNVLQGPMGGGLEGTIADLALKFIETEDPVKAQKLSKSLLALTWLPTNQSFQVDTGLTKIGGNGKLGNCSKVGQLAVQDFENHKVYYRSISQISSGDYIDARHYEDLRPFSRAFLRLHEAYLSMLHDGGMNLQDAETSTRQEIANIIDSPKFGKSLFAGFTQSSVDPSAYALYGNIWDEAMSIGYSGVLFNLTGTPSFKSTLSRFTEILTGLGLPCEMNEAAITSFRHSVYSNPQGSTVEGATQFANICMKH